MAGPGHMRSFSSASRAAAISSASELLPSSSSLLDSPLDSLAASSSFSFLLWPLKREEKQDHCETGRGQACGLGHLGAGNKPVVTVTGRACDAAPLHTWLHLEGQGVAELCGLVENTPSSGVCQGGIL